VPVPILREVIDILDRWFDPKSAESWDAVGLVCGDPAESVDRILLAVDAVPATVDEAIRTGARLLLTHHPLLLTGVHGVPADQPKGAMVHRMIRSGVAHFVAHTNADVAEQGVSDALAARLGLHGLRPLEPIPGGQLDKLVVFVPVEAAPVLIDSLAAAGAGQLGDYDHCAWIGTGEGMFRARPGAHPAVGSIGEVARLREARVEMVVPRAARTEIVRALRAAHPYEEPAFDLLPMADLPSRRGLGRVGELDRELRLAEFVDRVAAALPATVWGVRAAGDPDLLVRTVAVCGGSGSSLIPLARTAGAQVFVTSDLKHHQVVEQLTERAGDQAARFAVIDAAHWATELPFLHDLATRLRAQFGTTVEVAVSTQVTDPWRLHAPSRESSPNQP
jgi:dinuclear metal center YbgI/SA1388 family protein